MGRERGRPGDEVNFVRGEVIHDRERDWDERDRRDRFDRDMGRDVRDAMGAFAEFQNTMAEFERNMMAEFRTMNKRFPPR